MKDLAKISRVIIQNLLGIRTLLNLQKENSIIVPFSFSTSITVRAISLIKSSKWKFPFGWEWRLVSFDSQPSWQWYRSCPEGCPSHPPTQDFWACSLLGFDHLRSERPSPDPVFYHPLRPEWIVWCNIVKNFLHDPFLLRGSSHGKGEPISLCSPLLSTTL